MEESSLAKLNEAIKSKKRKKVLRLYLVPIATGIIFLLIMLIVVIPKIFEIVSLVETIGKKNEEIAQEANILALLQTLNARSNEVLFQLEQVNNITSSERTEVVAFRDKITQLMNISNLTIISQELSETNLEGIQEGTTGAITLIEVPFIFEVSGSYDNMIDFINVLSTLDDFVIVKEMELSQSIDTGSTWILKITLAKYQFNDTEDLRALFAGVEPGVTISPDVLEYIESRSGGQISPDDQPVNDNVQDIVEDGDANLEGDTIE